MSQDKKTKAYVKKLKNGFAIKTTSNGNGAENILIITSDCLSKSNRKSKNNICTQALSSPVSNLPEVSEKHNGKISKTLTRNNNAISNVLKNLEPYISEVKQGISGFHIFENGNSLSSDDVDESIIFVANTKLAQDSGVCFNLPGKLVNVHKTVSSENTLLTAETVVKPITIIVGNYVVHIKICCNIKEHLSKTTGTQTYSFFSETYDHPTVKNVKSNSIYKPITEETQTDENSSMPQVQFTATSKNNNYTMSTSKHQNNEEKESQIRVIDYYGPFDNKFSEHDSIKSSTTQTENIETNSLGTSTTDMIETDSFERFCTNYEDSEDNYCSSSQNLHKNKPLHDLYKLEDNYNLVTFDSHQHCYGSNSSFRTFISHHHVNNSIPPATQKYDYITPNNNSNSRKDILTIYNNSLSYTTTSNYDFQGNNYSSGQTVQKGLPKEHDSICNDTIEFDKCLTSKIPDNKLDIKVLKNKNIEVSSENISNSLENFPITAKRNGKTSTKNIIPQGSSSNYFDAQINQRKTYNDYSNEQKPLYCSYNFHCGFKKTETNTSFTNQNKYDCFIYSKRVKLFDKQNSKIWLSKTKLKISRPKLTQSFSTILAYFPLNNKTKRSKLKCGLKINSVHSICTRKNYSNNQTNNNMNDYENRSDIRINKNENLPNNVSILLSESESNKNKATCNFTENNFKNTCTNNNTDISKIKLKKTDQKVSHFISHEYICYVQKPCEVNMDISNSNTNNNISSATKMMLNDQQKQDYSKLNSLPIIDIFNKEATYRTSTSTINIIPSSQEIILANIDLSYNPKFKPRCLIKETKSWTASHKPAYICDNINRADSINTFKCDLSNHYSRSCPGKVAFSPTSQNVKNEEKKGKAKRKIRALMQYIFLNFHKDKKRR